MGYNKYTTRIYHKYNIVRSLFNFVLLVNNYSSRELRDVILWINHLGM